MLCGTAARSGEMEYAYQGEIMTPSRCGRMDQVRCACTAGPRTLRALTQPGRLRAGMRVRRAASAHDLRWRVPGCGHHQGAPPHPPAAGGLVREEGYGGDPCAWRRALHAAAAHVILVAGKAAGWLPICADGGAARRAAPAGPRQSRHHRACRARAAGARASAQLLPAALTRVSALLDCPTRRRRATRRSWVR